jgi:acetyl-CoA acyltransferase
LSAGALKRADVVWISCRTEYSISPKLYDDNGLSVFWHWSTLVSVETVGLTSMDPPSPKRANDDQLRTVCGPRWPTAAVNTLEQRGGRYGLQTMCEGGGMANATIIERLG